VAYDPAAGELNVLHLAPTRKDELIDEFVDHFAASGSEERDLQRSSLTMDDFYTVLTYARRAAVRALRSNDGELARRGVTALSVIDENRIDWRDLTWQAALLSYAIHRVSGNVTEAFDTAASLANGETSQALERLFTPARSQPRRVEVQGDPALRWHRAYRGRGQAVPAQIGAGRHRRGDSSRHGRRLLAAE
jgi:hypothetical protein